MLEKKRLIIFWTKLQRIFLSFPDNALSSQNEKVDESKLNDSGNSGVNTSSSASAQAATTGPKTSVVNNADGLGKEGTGAASAASMKEEASALKD